MPPDLNTMPPSPRTGSVNAQASSPMSSSARPSHPLRSLSSTSQTPTTQEQFPAMPRRHSRQMTPAELHLELEKEQEAVVNRLTRELSALRAHSSSIASNASTSSATSASSSQPPQSSHRNSVSVLDTSESASSSAVAGPRPTLNTLRHQRSSSSSIGSRTHSFTSATAGQSGTAHPSATFAHGQTSQASMDRARDAAGLGSSYQQAASVAPESTRSSRTNSAARNVGTSTNAASRQGPSHMAAASTRLEEAERARNTLDRARTENEMLIARVKDLERELRSVSPSLPREAERGRPSGRVPPSG